jgi:allophanate hydrolase subunit 1
MRQSSGGHQPAGNAILSLDALGNSSYFGLERKLKQVPGIAEVEVNYAANIVQVQFDPRKVSGDDIRAVMKKFVDPMGQRRGG